MKRPVTGIAGGKVLLIASLFFAACSGGLPPNFKSEVAVEAGNLANSRAHVQAAQTAIDADLARDPDLFRDTGQPAHWKSSLQDAAGQLRQAEKDDQALENLVRHNRADTRLQAERLLEEERRLRNLALTESQAAQSEADKWLAFKAALPGKLDDLQREYRSIHDYQLTSLQDPVHKAEIDWPAKKSALQERLQAVEEIPQSADRRWSDSEPARQHASAGAATGLEVATLIATEEALNTDQARLQRDSENLRGLSGQLYDSWDKILTDLDASRSENDRLFRERVKTVRAHLLDVETQKTSTSASEQWITVSESDFRRVQGDLGMAIAHKDRGLFDYEAQNTPQPPGFAYIATEEQGRNQYGYWGHEGGESVWHWLPEYLILRELLWSHDYRPVVLGEYRGYQVARDSGRTFYGQTTRNSPPKYGSGGTFTADHYAGSKYAQAGGFNSSRYASSPSFGSAHATGKPGIVAGSSSGAGKRFGSGVGSPSGRRFGQSRSFPSAGRSFGRRR